MSKKLKHITRSFAEISIGDIYASPDKLTDITYEVVSKDEKEKLIGLKCGFQASMKVSTIWRKTDSKIFNRLLFRPS